MITFVEETHKYFDSGGREVPGVTSILKKAGIVQGWKGGSTWYATRGRYVHHACALLDRGELDWESLDENIKPFVECYTAFIKSARPIIHMIEQIVSPPDERYAGTVDRLIELEDGTVLVLDIKCGVKHDWHWLQVAGYEDALYQNAGLSLLYLNGKGAQPRFLIHPEPGKVTTRWRRIIA